MLLSYKGLKMKSVSLSSFIILSLADGSYLETEIVGDKVCIVQQKNPPDFNGLELRVKTRDYVAMTER